RLNPKILVGSAAWIVSGSLPGKSSRQVPAPVLGAANETEGDIVGVRPIGYPGIAQCRKVAQPSSGKKTSSDCERGFYPWQIILIGEELGGFFNEPANPS